MNTVRDMNGDIFRGILNSLMLQLNHLKKRNGIIDTDTENNPKIEKEDVVPIPNFGVEISF